MQATTVTLPFSGWWLVQNSPADRVPSHGVDIWGQRYAIDFVGVDEHGRSAEERDWRTLLSTEPPERFLAYGQPILAPVAGRVVAVHDGEPDHRARRSQLALVPYALGQRGRVREGPDAIAGNHVAIRDHASGTFVWLAHLRRGSMRVAVGDETTVGQPLAECGNSGNSTQPHLHLQVTDGLDPWTAAGVPFEIDRYRERPPGRHQPVTAARGVPGNGSLVSP